MSDVLLLALAAAAAAFAVDMLAQAYVRIRILHRGW